MRSKVISDLNDKRIADICNKIFYYRKPENISTDTYRSKTSFMCR